MRISRDALAAELSAWSADSLKRSSSRATRLTGAAAIWSVPLVGGTPRKVIELGDERLQSYRFALSDRERTDLLPADRPASERVGHGSRQTRRRRQSSHSEPRPWLIALGLSLDGCGQIFLTSDLWLGVEG